MAKKDKDELSKAFESWNKDINSEPFNSGELERKAREQLEKDKKERDEQ